MDLLRRLIIEWIKTMDGNDPWGLTLGLYIHLISHGATSDDAIKAMELFADEILTMREKEPVE